MVEPVRTLTQNRWHGRSATDCAGEVRSACIGPLAACLSEAPLVSPGSSFLSVRNARSVGAPRTQGARRRAWRISSPSSDEGQLPPRSPRRPCQPKRYEVEVPPRDQLPPPPLARPPAGHACPTPGCVRPHRGCDELRSSLTLLQSWGSILGMLRRLLLAPVLVLGLASPPMDGGEGPAGRVQGRTLQAASFFEGSTPATERPALPPSLQALLCCKAGREPSNGSIPDHARASGPGALAVPAPARGPGRSSRAMSSHGSNPGVGRERLDSPGSGLPGSASRIDLLHSTLPPRVPGVGDDRYARPPPALPRSI